MSLGRRRTRRLLLSILPTLAFVWATLPLHGCFLLAAQQQAAAHVSHCAQVAAQFGMELPADIGAAVADHSDGHASSSDDAHTSSGAVMSCEDLGTGAPESRSAGVEGSSLFATFAPLAHSLSPRIEPFYRPAHLANAPPDPLHASGRAILRSKSVLLI
jgi:hypothetical protein